MPVTMNVAALRGAIALAKTITPTRSTIPILNCVNIAAKGGMARIEATDTASFASITIPAIGEGQWCIALDKLAIMIGAARGDDVSISGDTFAAITSGKAHAKIAALPPGDWPDMSPDGDAEHIATVSAKAFQSAYSRCAVAVSREASRYMLSGVHAVFADGSLRCEASNGHILHRITMAADVDSRADVLLPNNIGAPLAALAGDGEIVVSRHGGTVTFTCGGKRLTTKLLDAEFPDFDRVMPKISRVGAVVFDTKGLVDAIKSVAPLNRDDGSSVHLVADADGARLTAFGAPGETVVIPLESDGGALDAWLSPDYLADMISACGVQSVALRADGRAIMTGEPGDPFVGVVMSMRPRAGVALAEAA